MAHDENRDDALFAAMFADAFNDVVASDELKASTLALIFERMDDEETPLASHAAEEAFGTDELGEAAEQSLAELEAMAEPEPEALVAPAAGAQGDDAADRGDASASAPTDDHDEAGRSHLDVVDGGRAEAWVAGASAARPSRTVKMPALPLAQSATPPTARSTHRLGLRLRVAAAIVAVAVTAGGVAYAVPASQVEVTEDGTTIRLGVNVFGRTVSVDADSEAGRAVLGDLNVRNLVYEDALGRVIDRLDERGGGDGSVGVRVDGPLAPHRDDLSARADRVISGRGLERGSGLPAVSSAPTSSEAPTGDGPADVGDSGATIGSGVGSGIGRGARGGRFSADTERSQDAVPVGSAPMGVGKQTDQGSGASQEGTGDIGVAPPVGSVGTADGAQGDADASASDPAPGATNGPNFPRPEAGQDMGQFGGPGAGQRVGSNAGGPLRQNLPAQGDAGGGDSSRRSPSAVGPSSLGDVAQGMDSPLSGHN